MRLIDILYEQGQKIRDALALWNEDTRLTYGEMWENVEKQSACFRRTGIVEGTKVAIKISATMEKIIAILVVMHLRAKFIVFENDKMTKIQMDELMGEVGCTRLITLGKAAKDGMEYEISDTGVKAHESKNEKNNEFFYITTSGSTGKAKLIAKEDEELYECALNLKYNTNFRTGGNGMQFCSLHFAFGYVELFCQLIFGNSIYCYPAEERTNVIFLLDCIRKYSVDTVYMPTVVFDLLLKSDDFLSEYPKSLRQIVVGGSKLSVDEAAAKVLLKNNLKLYNCYGCAEFLMIAVHECSFEKDDLTNVPAGRKGMFTKIRLDCEDQDKGLLYVGEALVENNECKNDEMHCTGDLCAINEFGEIVILGRRGSQIKINGCRMDIEDIRRYLLKLSAVKECCICLVKTEKDKFQMFAFIITNGVQDIKAIRESLSEMIPQYMIPMYIEIIDEIQRLPSGKYDKVYMSAKAQALVNEQKCKSDKVMSTVLKMISVENESNLNNENLCDQKFGELGFDSIMIAMFIYQIEKEFNKKISFKEIGSLNNCSVGEVVRYICER